MELNEIYEKYLSNDSFRKEIKELLDKNDLDAAIRKFGLSCTKDEVAEFINNNTESSNCGEKDEIRKKIKYLEGKIEDYEAIRKNLGRALTIACKNENYEEIKRIKSEIDDMHKKILETQAQIDELKKQL